MDSKYEVFKGQQWEFTGLKPVTLNIRPFLVTMVSKENNIIIFSQIGKSGNPSGDYTKQVNLKFEEIEGVGGVPLAESEYVYPALPNYKKGLVQVDTVAEKAKEIIEGYAVISDIHRKHIEDHLTMLLERIDESIDILEHDKRVYEELKQYVNDNVNV